MEKVKTWFSKLDQDALKKMGIITVVFLALLVAGSLLSNVVAKQAAEAEAAAEAAKITAMGGEVNRQTGNSAAAASLASATSYMGVTGTDELEAVIICTDKDYADALSGTYLASVKSAPILILETKADGSIVKLDLTKVTTFLKSNLSASGTIYLLGGTAAIPQDVETTLGDYGTVVRLAADDRYATNLKVLEEAGLEDVDTLLVASGEDYADSISAASTGLPILLVGEELTVDEQNYLKSGEFANIYVLGGTSAVSTMIENALGDYADNVERISGTDRFTTSTAIAGKLFEAPKGIAIAYGHDFTGGLAGGLLAKEMGAPVILVEDDATDAATEYVAGLEDGISYVITLASADQISDDTMNSLMK